ncbi:hypothetical protein PSEUBRA_004889 [Kalmanozyma brasiliensis GHG001]|uniref:uncharacterized protein n=1 Tax=Kalmanozyma brasiliensis (strain GHG001) TaxID=1365824 RepID=UPI0028682AE3|nr:uncharacterized protein PSEUBRA_004889 [Kalmanozyma brasiliensis GHG001]KAF6767454.1 hypothetical protein PSEUBRA_004889 [Kalmanozyma brasiliensis GHG001]
MSFTSEEAFEQLAELQSGIAAVSLGAVAARDQIRALEEEALANFSQLDISDSDLFAALKTTFVKNIRQLEVLAPMMVAFERLHGPLRPFLMSFIFAKLRDSWKKKKKRSATTSIAVQAGPCAEADAMSRPPAASGDPIVTDFKDEEGSTHEAEKSEQPPLPIVSPVSQAATATDDVSAQDDPRAAIVTDAASLAPQADAPQQQAFAESGSAALHVGESRSVATDTNHKAASKQHYSPDIAKILKRTVKFLNEVDYRVCKAEKYCDFDLDPKDEAELLLDHLYELYNEGLVLGELIAELVSELAAPLQGEWEVDFEGEFTGKRRRQSTRSTPTKF